MMTSYYSFLICRSRYANIKLITLKGYGFEIENFNSKYRIDGGPFYDQMDEWEAYSRGVLFGGERIYILPNIYSKLQKNPKNATQLPAIILNNPMEIQKIANRTKSAFRINGVTYVYE